MKERQRWRPEEDTLLRAYVKQYGPREWNLVSQRMNAPFSRDAKSCLERWKNYLKPGIKKGSLSEEEQQLVISLQAKHGNKWKKIAAEIPGRTAKRLGKWWEVFKEKQQREEMKECNVHQVEDGKYDRILENFAEKLVKERMPAPTLIPPLAAWPLASNLSNPSLALTLSSSSLPTESVSLLNGHQPNGGNLIDSPIISSVLESFKEMDEDHRAWMTYKKETAWRLRRVELQLESEMANRRREKIEEIESKIKALEEKQKIELERLDTEYKEQLQCLRQDADTKEMKLMEKWAAQHLKLCSLLRKFTPEATMS